MLKFLERFEFDFFYKALFALSSVILIFSLFFPIIGLPQIKIQLISFVFLSYSILSWIIRDFIKSLRIYAKDRDVNLGSWAAHVIIQIILIMIVIIFIFLINLYL